MQFLLVVLAARSANSLLVESREPGVLLLADAQPLSSLDSGVGNVFVARNGSGSLDTRSLFSRQLTCPAATPVRCAGGCCQAGTKCVSKLAHFYSQYTIRGLLIYRRFVNSVLPAAARSVQLAIAAETAAAVRRATTARNPDSVAAQRQQRRAAALPVMRQEASVATVDLWGARRVVRVAARLVVEQGPHAAKAGAAAQAARSVAPEVVGFRLFAYDTQAVTKSSAGRLSRRLRVRPRTRYVPMEAKHAAGKHTHAKQEITDNQASGGNQGGHED
jgi:pyruvate/2-oxoglutarate dehydrogenase complex dihydrolipoamide acyltransferase (E2) component